MAAYSFLFGGNTGETPETLKRKRELALAIMGAQGAPKNVGEGLNALGAGIVAGVLNRRADKAESEGRADADALFDSGLRGQLAAKIAGTTPSITPSGGQGPVASGPVTTSGDVYSPFMDTVKTGISNPYGLAAVASTANAESRFSPGNANRAWSDPSERGVPGTAGGIMSWRDDRLNNLYSFAGQKGEEQGAISPTTQAEFFLQENPALITALNNAKSVEEAQKLMNEAWKFAGWNRPGGEAANRMASANAYLPSFQGQPQPREVASLDPSVGMPETSAGAVTAMGQGNFPQPVNAQSAADAGRGAIASASPFAPPSLSDEVAAYEQTPEYAARFPGRTQPQGIPPQFKDSQQLADARGGILPALMGGEPATPEQVAQARMEPSDQGPDPATLYQILTHPFSSPEQKAVAQMMLEQQTRRQQADYERQAQQNDPLYRIKLQQAEKELADGKRQPLINAGNGNVYDPNDKTWITPPGASGAGGGFRFSGNSVEAQALNGLMDSGQLTPDQAQQLGAGKTITGPNGEIIFLTPQGVFGTTPAQGGAVQPIMPNGGQAAPQGSAQTNPQAIPHSRPQQGPQQPAALQKGQPARSGNIQITEPKVTVDEKEAAGFADRMAGSGALVDRYAKAGLSVKDQFIRGNDYIPDFLENWMVGNDFQKFDQARRDFINAQLRRESGAVISPEEFDNANKQYFPQPGDGPDVLEQKRRNRQTVIGGMSRSAGPTYSAPAGESDPLGIR